MFGCIQDGLLLAVREWFFTPDKKSCRPVCFLIEENPESYMRMSVILHRCPVGLFTGEEARRFPLCGGCPLPSPSKEFPNHSSSKALGKSNDGFSRRTDSGTDRELNETGLFLRPRL